jgi:hypothetical protein
LAFLVRKYIPSGNPGFGRGKAFFLNVIQRPTIPGKSKMDLSLAAMTSVTPAKDFMNFPPADIFGQTNHGEIKLRNIVFWDFYGLKSLQFGPTEVYSVLP